MSESMSVEDRGLLFLSGGGDSTGAVATHASTGEKWLLGLMGTVGTALLVGAIWASEKHKKNQYQPTREQYRPELVPSKESIFRELQSLPPEELAKGTASENKFVATWAQLASNQGDLSHWKLFARVAPWMRDEQAVRDLAWMTKYELAEYAALPPEILRDVPLIPTSANAMKRAWDATRDVPESVAKRILVSGNSVYEWLDLDEASRARAASTFEKVQRVWDDFELDPATAAKISADTDFTVLSHLRPRKALAVARDISPVLHRFVAALPEREIEALDIYFFKSDLERLLKTKFGKALPRDLAREVEDAMRALNGTDYLAPFEPFTREEIKALERAGLSALEIASVYQGYLRDDQQHGNRKKKALEVLLDEPRLRAMDKAMARDMPAAARMFPDEYKRGQKVADVMAVVVDEIVDKAKRGEPVVIHGRDGELFYELVKRDPRASAKLMKNVHYILSPRTLTTTASSSRPTVDQYRFEDYIRRLVPPNAWHYDTGYTGSIPRHIQDSMGIPIAGIRMVSSTSYPSQQINVPGRTDDDLRVIVADVLEGSRHRHTPSPAIFDVRVSPDAPGFWARLWGVLNGWRKFGRGTQIHEPVPPSSRMERVEPGVQRQPTREQYIPDERHLDLEPGVQRQPTREQYIPDERHLDLVDELTILDAHRLLGMLP